jgi:tripartite-type tricarboxylate transporter receptor subunit TctC
MRAAASLKTLAVALATACLALAASAQQPSPAAPFPTKTVRLTVHNSPGSAPDVLARYLSQRLAEQWKQPVVVDNRGAAGGIVAADALAKSQPDGHSLLVGGDGPITILPNLQHNLPYNAQRDLVPVVSLGHVDFVLVANAKTGFRSLADFVRAAKAEPGRYSYASAGNGSALQFSMELLKQQAGFFATHIPYRGGPLGLQDVVAGQVEVMFVALGPALPHIRSGRVVALATTGEKRNTLLPEVPTVGETYHGYRSGTWFGLFAPANTPQPVLDTIAADAARIVQTPAARAELSAQGIDATGAPQQQFQRQVAAEYGRYAQLVKTAGIKAE